MKEPASPAGSGAHMSSLKKAVVTGGAGFIGSHLSARLASLGCRVVVLDDFRTGRAEALEGVPVELVRGCVTNGALVRELAVDADIIFHLGSLVSVSESLALPEESVRVNVGGTLAVLQAARANRVPRVVFASSAAVYGDAAPSPQREGHPPAPLSPYGVTKLDGEHYFEIWRRCFGVGTVSLRFFNVFGPGQVPGGPYGAAVPAFIQKALAREDLVVDGDGLQTRDFVYIADAVDAYLLAARTPEMHGAFNVGCGSGVTILDLARQVLRETGSDARLVHGPPRPGDIRHSVADTSRIQAFGYEPRVELAEGLRRTVEYFRKLSPATV